MIRDARIDVHAGDPLRCLVSLALLLVFAWTLRCGIDEYLALAGDRPRPVREVVIHGKPFPSALAIVVDASGSMATQDGLPYALACHEAIQIAMQATDAARIRFYVFAAAAEEEPQGWIALPDRERIEKAYGWLRERPTSGNTDLVGALERVLALEESPLGVIAITDEDVDNGPQRAAEKIAALNANRAAPAVIGIIGIEPANPAADRLGGAVWRRLRAREDVGLEAAGGAVKEQNDGGGSEVRHVRGSGERSRIDRRRGGWWYMSELPGSGVAPGAKRARGVPGARMFGSSNRGRPARGMVRAARGGALEPERRRDAARSG